MRTIITDRTLLVSLSIVLLIALYLLQSEKLVPLEIHPDMVVSYDDSQGIAVEKYIVQNSENLEEFLIAPSTPSALKLALRSQKDIKISLHIEPLYLPKDCTLNQMGLSTLKLQHGPKETDAKHVTLNNIYDVDLELSANQPLSIMLEDGVNGRCGKATLTVYKRNNSLIYLGVFVLTWSLLALLLATLNSNPLFAALGATINLLFILANITIASTSLLNFNISMLFCVGVSGLLLILISLPLWRWLQATLITAAISTSLCLPIIYIAYPFLFNGPVTEDTIHAVLQSNIRQATEFWFAFVGLKLSAALTLCLLILFALSYLIIKANINKRTTFVTGTILIAASLMPWRAIIDHTPIFERTVYSITDYFKELRNYKELREKRIAKLIEVGADTTQSNQTLVIVLGESASKHHYSSYGYGRPTTPHADRMIKSGAMIRFNAAYSNHVHSNPTISHALTSANSYTNEEWLHAPSILSLANAAGVDTAWVSNKPMYGVWDNHMNVIGNEAKHVSFINKRVGTEKYSNQHDGAMLPLVYEAISKDKNNELIFMHLQGSHVEYCARVPNGFDYLKHTPKRHVYGDFLNLKENNNLITRYINCYDNSIRYTDYVLKNLIENLKEKDKPSAVYYISDHGENVMDNKAHNASEFDYYMVEVPAFFWANSAWRQQNPEKWQTLIKNRDKVFTNDHLFELVNGLAGVVSPAVNTQNDPSSNNYKEPTTPKTMHGDVNLNAIDNWSFWQPQNIRSLHIAGQIDKVVAHRTNTISKAGTLLVQGLGALEIDLNLHANKNTVQFMVGHDAQSSAEINLHDFLNHLDWENITHLWLDMRNLNADNVELAIKRLNTVNQKFAIKQKAILLVNSNRVEFKQLSEQGYQLAYAVSDTELDNNQIQTQQFINEHSQSAQQIGASIISLPASAYSHIQHGLRPLLNNNQSLHLRLPKDLTLATPNLDKALAQQDYFIDPQVSAISFAVQSRHNL